MSARLYFEDFLIEEDILLGSISVSKEELLEFADKFDPQSIHVDEEKAKHSIYGGLIASGWHTCALVMRVMCDSFLNDSAHLGSPGLEYINWHNPVRAGDTLTVYRTIESCRTSKSRPEIGIVISHWRVTNQDDIVVLTMRGSNFFARRGNTNNT